MAGNRTGEARRGATWHTNRIAERHQIVFPENSAPNRERNLKRRIKWVKMREREKRG